MDGDNRLVYEFIPMSSIGSNRPGADGVRVEKFPRVHYIADLAEIQNVMTEIQCEPEQFPGRIIFMLYNDIVWREKGNEELCIAISQNHSRICKKIRVGRFSGLNQKRNGTELTRTSRMEHGIVSLRT